MTDDTAGASHPQPAASRHTVAFLPWFAIDGDSQVGNCWLLRYERGHLPAGKGTADQERIDFATKAFLESEEPIGAATILRVDDGSPTRELNEEERNKVFQITEMLTTAALAGREYFQGASSYCNRDAFRLVMLSVPEKPTSGWTVTSRRRDGRSRNMYSAAIPEHRPPHVVHCRTASIDGELFEALTKLRSEKPDLWDRVRDAITSFNDANTDSDRITKGQEVVLTFGALQRLLDVDHKTDELAAEIATFAKPNADEQLPADLAKSWPRSTVREAWIRDLSITRDAFAHGKTSPGSKRSWDVNEHLLFGAAIFPLLLKRVLAREGLYAMKHWDERDIDLFERRVLARPFKVPAHDDETEPDWPWLRVRREALWSEVRRNAARALDQASDLGKSADANS
ncbi:MAG: hypothetical protein WAT39_03975 [Planctomycetota bacterium]